MRNPPETSAVFAPLARMVATSALAPGIDADALAGLFQQAGGLALQQRHAFPQRADEIDFAVHGAARDRGDLGLDADEIGDLVQHLIGDDGGFHVGQKQAFLPPRQALRDEVDRRPRQGAARGGLGLVRVEPVEGDIAGKLGRKPGRAAEMRAQLFQRAGTLRRPRIPRLGPCLAAIKVRTLPSICATLSAARDGKARSGLRIGP